MIRVLHNTDPASLILYLFTRDVYLSLAASFQGVNSLLYTHILCFSTLTTYNVRTCQHKFIAFLYYSSVDVTILLIPYSAFYTYYSTTCITYTVQG